MKKKKIISAIILFGLALSSCDKKNASLVNRRTATHEKIEEIKKAQRAKTEAQAEVQTEIDLQKVDVSGSDLTPTSNPTDTPIVPIPDLRSRVNTLADLAPSSTTLTSSPSSPNSIPTTALISSSSSPPSSTMTALTSSTTSTPALTS